MKKIYCGIASLMTAAIVLVGCDREEEGLGAGDITEKVVEEGEQAVEEGEQAVEEGEQAVEEGQEAIEEAVEE